MIDFSPPAASALRSADQQRLAALSATVVAARAPAPALLDVLRVLEEELNPALAAAVFESVVWRVDVRHYWVYYRVAKAYAALGPEREDAAYLTAAMAAQMEPLYDGSSRLFHELFQTLRRRDRLTDALDVFDRAIDLLPERPAGEPHQIRPLLERAGRELPAGPAPAPGAAIVHRVMEPELRPGATMPVFGGDIPYGLRPLTGPLLRDPIDVLELHDAEVMLCHDAVVVIDRDGAVHPSLSVASYPHHVRRKVERMADGSRPADLHEADMAVLLSDRFPAPNLCHFLLDQTTRLALYRRAGVDTGAALAIGPVRRTDYQQRIAARAGVTRWLDTARMARVRVRRLWVSSNCRDLQHAAHLGADWAVGFARDTLGGAGTRGWRRLYISRGDVTVRQVSNEAEVMALLEPHGFEAIRPGSMPYEAQLAAFRQASHVVAPHGAALAHLAVCPPETQVLELFHPLYSTSAYALLATGLGLRYAAMTARDAHSDAPEWNDPSHTEVGAARFLDNHLRVDPSALQSWLATAL